MREGIGGTDLVAPTTGPWKATPALMCRAVRGNRRKEAS